MAYLIKRNIDRLHRQDNWKKSWYAFFPHQTYFGKLTGFSEDIVEGGQGFGMHPHQDMEIITIPVAGAQTHQDTTGSKHIIDSNSVQVMSAGTGIYHSEFNASPTEPFRSFQIWVIPEKIGVQTRHEVLRYQPEDKINKILTAITPDRRNNSIYINQHAFFSLGMFSAGKQLSYELNNPDNGVYVHVVNGSIAIEDNLLDAGDSIGIWETVKVVIEAQIEAELIIVEVPVDKIKL